MKKKSIGYENYLWGVKRNLPLAILYLIIMGLGQFLVYFNCNKYLTSLKSSDYFEKSHLTQMMMDVDITLTVTATICTIFFGISILFRVFGYMNSKTKLDFYHALPIKRSTLLHSNSLTVLTIVGLPFALVKFTQFLIVYIVIPAKHNLAYILDRFNIGSIIFSIELIVLVLLLILLCIIKFNKVFDAGLSFVGFLCNLILLPLCLSYIISLSGRETFYLFQPLKDKTVIFSNFIDTFWFKLTPMAYIKSWYYSSSQIVLSLIWMALLIGLYVLAVHAYKKKSSEYAESISNITLSFRILHIISGVTFFLCALVFTCVVIGSNLAQWIISILFTLVAFYCLEAIYSRSFSTIKNKTIDLIISFGLSALILASIHFDVLGLYANEYKANQDENAYDLLRDGDWSSRLPQKFKDDTMLEELLEKGRLSEPEKGLFAQRHSKGYYNEFERDDIEIQVARYKKKDPKKISFEDRWDRGDNVINTTYYTIPLKDWKTIKNNSEKYKPFLELESMMVDNEDRSHYRDNLFLVKIGDKYKTIDSDHYTLLHQLGDFLLDQTMPEQDRTLDLYLLNVSATRSLGNEASLYLSGSEVKKIIEEGSADVTIRGVDQEEDIAITYKSSGSLKISQAFFDYLMNNNEAAGWGYVYD